MNYKLFLSVTKRFFSKYAFIPSDLSNDCDIQTILQEEQVESGEKQVESAHTPSPISNKGTRKWDSGLKKPSLVDTRRKQRASHSLFLDESPLVGGEGMDGQQEEHDVKQVVDLYSLKCLFQDIGCNTNINDLYRFVGLITMNMNMTMTMTMTMTITIVVAI